jgi:class 3 adenylate cyclase/tetratricopeptide (TPR) repeat protein
MTVVGTVQCPSCGTTVPDRFRRCGHCGVPLDPSRASEEIRRTVTIVTSDLKGSTSLGERLDPESLRELLTRYFDEMRVVFESHGGTIEKIIGDAIVAVFGLPTHHDNDPLRGVAAAAESLRTLNALNEHFDRAYGVRLVNRTGIATGEVIVGEASQGQHVLTGETVRVATAMEQNSPPLEALLAASTRDLLGPQIEVEPVEPFVPKGMSEPVRAYRLVALTAEAEAALRDSLGSGVTDGRACPNCGEENPADFVHCGTCGGVLERTAPAPERRKTVTLVFADPRPTTPSGERPSPEALRPVMSRYFDAVRPILERHGGTVEKFIGDAVMAVFGLPVLHEDDAIRATRAALEMQAALPELNVASEAEWGVTLENHIGVNTGEVIAGDASLGQRLVTGDAVNTAARLEQTAGPREVLIGDLTYRLARDAVQVEEVEPLTLKGKAEPVPAYRLLGVSTVDQAARRRHDAPMVGREQELAALSALYGRAVEERSCRLATVVGDAGVGKSRLIAEFTARAASGARVIRGRCLPYGDGITFWPLREAARDAAGIGADEGAASALRKLRETVAADDVADRLASVMGLSPTPYPVPEIYWGARKFLEHLATPQPVLMVIEDIHWAESTFLEMIQHLVQSVEGAPVVLLCTSRHELLDRDPSWGEGEAAVRLVLRPLTDADAGQVVAGLLGGTGLPDAVRARIVEAAAGNPLFVEQLLSMLIDNGSLRQADGRWEQVRDLTELDVPPTIQALLAARLDLLELPERGVIEPASVIGQTFAQAAVAELVPHDQSPEVPARLETIARRELIAPNPGGTGDETAFRFAHILVKDAAYNGLLKRARADFHERFVDWAEELNRRQGASGQEFEEIHGYHLEQAYRYLAELGTLDEHARQVGVRASVKLANAGRRAQARGDVPAAVSMLKRATSTRAPEDADRLALLPDLGQALLELGDFPGARSVLREAVSAARAAGNPRLEAEATLVDLMVQLFSEESADWSRAVTSETEKAIPIFEATNDHAGLAFAWRLRYGMYSTAGQYGDCTAASEKVIDYARLAGNVALESRGAQGYASAAPYGPVPVTEAVARCEELLERTRADRRAVAAIQGSLSQLYAMEGDFDRARGTYTGLRPMLNDLGQGPLSASVSLDSARVELLAGDLAAAEHELRQDYDALSAMGERFLRSSVAGLLARVVALQGRDDEAIELTRVVEQIAADDDVDAQALWRGARARAMAHKGSRAAAIELAKGAVALRRRGDSPVLQAEALTDLAAVQQAAGRDPDAASAIAEALWLVERKGDVASASRLRAWAGPGVQAGAH